MSVKRKTVITVLSVMIIATLAFIWGNSMLSKTASAKESTGVYGFFSGILNAVFGEGVITHEVFRKLTHFGEFTLLGLEICGLYFAIGNMRLIKFLHILPYGLFVAVADESIQILSNRGPAVVDVLIDYSGYCVANIVFAVVYIVLLNIRKHKNEMA